MFSSVSIHHRALRKHSLSGLVVLVRRRSKAVQVPVDRLNRHIDRNRVVRLNGVGAGLSIRSYGDRGSATAVAGKGSGSGGGRVCPLNLWRETKRHSAKNTADEHGQTNGHRREKVHDRQIGCLEG